nr:N-acetylmuramoyl-L-alanine amidase [Chthoniobacterales bacterium]
ITIHHAGVLWTNKKTPPVMIKNMQSWGKKEKKWPDVPYHFLIGPDGTIYEGRSLLYEPDTNTKYEVSGHIGVELMGNFEEQRMSESQLKSLVDITAWLAQEFEINPDHIGGHKDVAPDQTTCPGKDLHRYIEDGAIATWTTAMRAGEKPEIVYREALPGGPAEVITLKPPTSQPK